MDSYTAPALQVRGSLSELTLMQYGTPNTLDGSYPQGTPSSDPIWQYSH